MQSLVISKSTSPVGVLVDVFTSREENKRYEEGLRSTQRIYDDATDQADKRVGHNKLPLLAALGAIVAGYWAVTELLGQTVYLSMATLSLLVGAGSLLWGVEFGRLTTRLGWANLKSNRFRSIPWGLLFRASAAAFVALSILPIWRTWYLRDIPATLVASQPAELATAAHGDTSPLQIRAFLKPGSVPLDTELAGIKWQPAYRVVELQLMNVSDLNAVDTQLSIRLDTHIADASQLTDVPDVTIYPSSFPGVEFLGLTGEDAEGNKITVPLVSDGPVITARYGLDIPRIPWESGVRFVLGASAEWPRSGRLHAEHTLRAPRSRLDSNRGQLSGAGHGAATHLRSQPSLGSSVRRRGIYATSSR